MSSALMRFLPAVTLGAAGLAAAWVAGPQVPATGGFELLLFGLAVLVTELLPIRLPRSRTVATSTAVLAAGALLGVATAHLALMAALGWLVSRRADPDSDPLLELVLRIATACALGGAAAFARTGIDPWDGPLGSDLRLDLLAATAVVAILILLLPATQVGGVTKLRYVFRRLVDELRISIAARVAVASTAVLGALVHATLGAWTLPSVLVPLLAARVGLGRFAGVTVAYDQTIRAMSRLPEQLGVVRDDHGVHVGRLAAAVADELGVDLGARVDLERAAHLHELGHIQFEPGTTPSRASMAAAGARVLASAGDLDRVAAIVAAHGDLSAAASASPDVARAARIVAACCEASRSRVDVGDQAARAALTLRLVQHSQDLEVVQAVLRVLERRGDLTPV